MFFLELFALFCLGAIGYFLGYTDARRAQRAIRFEEMNREENEIWCEQTKWRLKLADTIEVIETKAVN